MKSYINYHRNSPNQPHTLKFYFLSEKLNHTKWEKQFNQSIKQTDKIADILIQEDQCYLINKSFIKAFLKRQENIKISLIQNSKLSLLKQSLTKKIQQEQKLVNQFTKVLKNQFKFQIRINIETIYKLISKLKHLINNKVQLSFNSSIVNSLSDYLMQNRNKNINQYLFNQFFKNYYSNITINYDENVTMELTQFKKLLNINNCNPNRKIQRIVIKNIKQDDYLQLIKIKIQNSRRKKNISKNQDIDKVQLKKCIDLQLKYRRSIITSSSSNINQSKLIDKNGINLQSNILIQFNIFTQPFQKQLDAFIKNDIFILYDTLSYFSQSILNRCKTSLTTVYPTYKANIISNTKYLCFLKPQEQQFIIIHKKKITQGQYNQFFLTDMINITIPQRIAQFIQTKNIFHFKRSESNQKFYQSTKKNMYQFINKKISQTRQKEKYEKCLPAIARIFISLRIQQCIKKYEKQSQQKRQNNSMVFLLQQSQGDNLSNLNY